MTYAIPKELQPIGIRLDDKHQPTSIFWLGTEHRIERISNSYRVPDGTLESPISRDYFEIITVSGWLMLIYHDLLAGGWGLEVLYD